MNELGHESKEFYQGTFISATTKDHNIHTQFKKQLGKVTTPLKYKNLLNNQNVSSFITLDRKLHWYQNIYDLKNLGSFSEFQMIGS